MSSPPRLLFLAHAPNEEHMRDMAELFRMSFVGPLAETGQANCEILWVGQWLEQRGESLDWTVFRHCIERRPDAVLSYGWWRERHSEGAGTVSLVTFYLLRALLGIRVHAYLFDQAGEHFRVTDELACFCDLAFTHEDEARYRAFTRYFDRHRKMIATLSPRLFHGDPARARPVDVGFAGGVAGYPPERARGLAALRGAGVEVDVPGGRGAGEHRLTNEEYAGFFKESKIVLNWSRHISGLWFQAKGRIFEATLAGALLVCEECPEVNRYFRPHEEYVPFSDESDLVDKVKRYLARPEERLAIAQRGHRRALGNYSAQAQWGRTLAEMAGPGLYDEADALAALSKNASRRELDAVQLFERCLPSALPGFDSRALARAAAAVRAGHPAFESALRRERFRQAWHWRKLLRRIVPASITRDRLRSILRRG